MRKAICLVMLACLGAIGAVKAVAVPTGSSESQLLKQRQKEERKALKMRMGFANQSMKGQNLSPAARAAMKHQLKREERALRERQKNERQELKDRERMNRENQKLYGQ